MTAYPSPQSIGTVVAIITATLQRAFPAARFLIDEMTDDERREALQVFGQLSAGALARIAAEEGRPADDLLREIATGLATQFPIT